LALVSIMMVSMSHVLGRQQRFSRALAEARAATRIAESALTELQTGRFRADAATGGRVKIRTLADRDNAANDADLKDGPADAAAALPPGYVWVEVFARSGSKSASLVGAVPRTAAAEAIEGTRNDETGDETSVPPAGKEGR
jgi:hypothetical protein